MEIKDDKDKALKALARSLQLDLTPAAEALEAFFEHPSAAAAQVLQARLPELLPEDPQSALILEQALAEAYTEAVTDGVEVVGNKAEEPLTLTEEDKLAICRELFGEGVLE